MSGDSDLTPEELKEQEEQAKARQFENNLPENGRSFYQRPDFDAKLVAYKYKPPGPYSNILLSAACAFFSRWSRVV